MSATRLACRPMTNMAVLGGCSLELAAPRMMTWSWRANASRFAALAKELGVVLPISYYERANNAYYNSLAVADADGTIVGRYRKSHIPDGPGCEVSQMMAW